MIIGIPVMDGRDWTIEAIRNIHETTVGNVSVTVIDDQSEKPYCSCDFTPRVRVLRTPRPEGFYYPLRTIAAEARSPKDIVAIVHNDLRFYERGWDKRIVEAFEADNRLALVGVCGSYEVDEHGGRGAGTMVHFRGAGQSQAAGERITTLRPAVVLDSMLMAFRAGAVPLLRVDEDVPSLAHFYDKIWPLRLVARGFRVAVLGTEVDHWGGITCVANPRFSEACRQWCADRGLPRGADGDPAWGNWNLVMYKEAERRMMSEFSGRLVPCSVRPDYSIVGATVGQEAVPW